MPHVFIRGHVSEYAALCVLTSANGSPEVIVVDPIQGRLSVPTPRILIDHLVGRGEHHPRHADAERFRGLEVYDEEIVRINVAELI